MDITAARSFAAQEISTNKVQAGYDVLTRTVAKSQQSESASQGDRQKVAEFTGKGLNIDTKA